MSVKQIETRPLQLPQGPYRERPTEPGRRSRSAGTIAVLAAVAFVSGLSGCGGGGNSGVAPAPDNTSPPTAAPSPSPSPSVPEASARRALIVDLDGATYSAVQKGIAAGTLPNLAKLDVRLAYGGGMASTPSQQPTLDSPGWATLLTGTWASRHQVVSEAPKQALRASTVFQMTRQAGNTTSGAAVASTSLANLLSSDKEAGFLDVLADCSKDAAATDCVTTQAAQMIGGSQQTVLAQYRAAKDAALDYGIESSQYTATLSRLDGAVGKLVAATGQRTNDRWLVLVTGNHGLSANSQDDGLPLLPESSTFLGANQPLNIGSTGLAAALPAKLADLYVYPSIADVAPTVLRYLSAMPDVRDHAMDGGQLVGLQAVSRLTATVADNNSADANVTLNWTAPANGAITVLRDGQVIASKLPAGTASYTDRQLSQVLSAKGSYQFNYVVQVGDGADAAKRAAISPAVSYVPPVPLAQSLLTGLVSYYPFSATLPPVDAMAHSVMGPAAASLPAAAGLVVPGPFAGTNGLLVDTNYVTTDGVEGYRLTPAAGFDVSKGTAPQFTLGLWFKTASCVATNNVTIISNKSYVSGGNAGVAIGLFASSGNQCGVAFNIGSGGGVRADGPTGPYTQISVNRWVYIAFSVDGVAKTMNMVVFDPVTSTTNRVAVGKSTGSVDLSKLSPYPVWGIGDDGTGTFLMNKCNGSVSPPYTAGKCSVAPTYQQQFGDLAMWNRVLSDAELQSVFLSNKPLSTLRAQ